MAKTILKLHANGDFETVGTSLTQSEIAGNYKFTENAITVPKIIEYPPPGYRNYFIEKNSVSGYITVSGSGGYYPGAIKPTVEGERTSEYINVEGWGNATIRIRFKNMSEGYEAYAGIAFYNNAKTYISSPYNDYLGVSSGSYLFEFTVPANVGFMRVCSNYYDTPGASVKISVEKGNTTNTKHYLAIEDMPEWVKDTGNPVSFFKEGVVIKGNIIQSENTEYNTI